MGIGQIVKGHINELLDLNKNLSQERIQICKQCPLLSPKFGGVCNNKLFLNPKNNDVSLIPVEGYFKGCGCRINSKTRLPNAKCPAGKW